MNKKQIVQRRSYSHLRGDDEHAKLRRQNDDLRAELKRVNQTLTQSVGKLNAAKRSIPEVKDETLKRELENLDRQNHQLRKQVQRLKATVPQYNYSRIQQLENMMKEKDREVDSKNREIKLLEKEKREMMKTNDPGLQLQKKIIQLNQETDFLKKKLTEARKKENQQEKSIKFQQEYLIKLQEKGRGQQVQIPKHINKECSNCSKLEQSISKLKEQINVLESNRASIEKKQQRQVQSLRAIIVNKQKAIKELQSDTRNKDKELKIINSRFREASNRRRMNDRIQKVPFFQIPKELRMILKGNTSAFMNSFNDLDQLREQEYRIERIKIGFKEDSILWMQTSYRGDDLITRQNFNLSDVAEEQQYKELLLDRSEGIVSIKGLYNKHIEYLHFLTNKGTVMAVGSDRNRQKSRQFQFEIRKSESIAGFLGGYNEELTFLGIALRMKKVKGGWSPRLERPQSESNPLQNA